jgi:hypothetical protein
MEFAACQRLHVNENENVFLWERLWHLENDPAAALASLAAFGIVGSEWDNVQEDDKSQEKSIKGEEMLCALPISSFYSQGSQCVFPGRSWLENALVLEGEIDLVCPVLTPS